MRPGTNPTKPPTWLIAVVTIGAVAWAIKYATDNPTDAILGGIPLVLVVVVVALYMAYFGRSSA